jgi:gentisate 1,2-dioxygenase
MSAASISSERREFYERLAQKSSSPLWESLGRLIPSEPRPQTSAAIWSYEDMRPLLLEAGRLITAKEAERRVLILENPGLRGTGQITGSLYAGLQLVLPGEITSTHRHVTTALRFVVESQGGYTAVDGERTTMRPGDLVITPCWTYHDHGNNTDAPLIWVDCLDLPMVNLFDASFAAPHPDGTQQLSRGEGDALARYGTNLLPLEHTAANHNSPVFNYPYARSREAMDRLYRNGAVDPRLGIKLQYSNPATGGPVTPTIGAFLQLLPAGFRTAPYRSTDATIYCVAEGSGRTRIGGETIAWRQHDVFVGPAWMPVSHEAGGEAVLFSFSDRPAQKALGVWREEFQD